MTRVAIVYLAFGLFFSALGIFRTWERGWLSDRTAWRIGTGLLPTLLWLPLALIWFCSLPFRESIDRLAEEEDDRAEVRKRRKGPGSS